MPLSQEIIDIEQKMEISRKSYFEETTNLLKWTTAFAVVAILWIGNNVNSELSLSKPVQYWTAFFSLLFFLISIVSAIYIFYYVTKFWNDSWMLHYRHRRSLMSQPIHTSDDFRQMGEIVTELSSSKIEKLAFDFLKVTFFHIASLIIGFALFLGYITIK
jgi:hypothetical protein